MKKILLISLSIVLAMAVSASATQITRNQPLPKHNPQELLSKTRIVVDAPRFDPSASSMRNKAPQLAQEAVLPPADLVIERYSLNGYLYDGSNWTSVNRNILIGFDGMDVYLQGFSILIPDAWIKGTLSDDNTTVTFPMQYMGSAYDEDIYFYPVTYAGAGFAPIDAVFEYNERESTFTLSQDQVTVILENASADEVAWVYQYDSWLTISPLSGAVEVPEGLEAQPYMLTGVYMGYDDDGSWFEGDPLMGSAMVGFDGDDIYVQGLCSYLPNAWVKGHREGDNYVIDNGQYFGTFIYDGDAYPLFFMGCEPETNDEARFVLTLDPETGVLVSEQWYGICSSDVGVYWYDLLGNVVMTPVVDKPAVPAAPSVLYYEYYDEDGFGFIMLNIPTFSEDGEPLMADRLGYQLFCDYGYGPEPYIFWGDIYGFDDDQTVIPYLFNDDMNILMGGELLIIYFIDEGIKRIGVQSVYEGGGETNCSEIGWYQLIPTSVTDVVADDNRTIEYYDLMGRRVDASKLTRGIYVTSDGRKILVK